MGKKTGKKNISLSKECQCKGSLHKGQPCINDQGLPHSSKLCTWCRNEGHPQSLSGS